MNPKQEIALLTIARWADCFECIKRAVIYGSVARGDERPDSDFRCRFVTDLSAPGMAASYTKAQHGGGEATGIRDVRQRDLAMAVESEKPFREDSPTSEFHRLPRIFKSSRSGQEQASARARA